MINATLMGVTGEDVLLIRVVRAAVTYGWEAVEAGLGLLARVIPNLPTGGHDASSTAARTAEPRVQPPSTHKSETVRFALDGQAYEIDLRPEDAREMRVAFQRYVAAGRPVARSSPQAPADGRAENAGSAEHHGETAVIREWARAHGHQVSDRGRIPSRVLDAYRATR